MDDEPFVDKATGLPGFVVRMITCPPVHDEPMPGAWQCGECPYTNVDVICTKCGAPRWAGQELR